MSRSWFVEHPTSVQKIFSFKNLIGWKRQIVVSVSLSAITDARCQGIDQHSIAADGLPSRS
jgi:hypothetical protein